MSATKVRIAGFQLTLAKNISIGEFYRTLEAAHGIETNVSGKTNLLLTDVTQGYIVGAILVYKGDKKSVATRKAKADGLLIDRIKLKENQEGTEVSFFCINPRNLKGVFYKYMGGPAHTSYAKIFKRQHDQVRKQLTKEKVKEFSKLSSNTQITKNSRHKAIKYYSGAFEFSYLLRPYDIDALLKNYMEISHVEVSAEEALSGSSIFSPLSPFAGNTRVKIATEKKTPINVISTAIKSTFQSFSQPSKIKVLKLYGRSLLGNQIEYSLGDNITHYGEMTYDDYIDLMPPGYWESYTSSGAIKELIRTISSNPTIFGKPSISTTWKLKSIRDLIKEKNSEATDGITT